MNDYGWYRLSPKHKWHLVESIVAGVRVTYCGRDLVRRHGDEESKVEPLTRLIGQPQNCKTCS
jgi:hypothetical protein